MVGSRPSLPSWIGAAATRVDIEGNVSSMSDTMFRENREESAPPEQYSKALSDGDLGFGQRAFSAAGAAFISAIIVNPLDVAKVIVYHLFSCCMRFDLILGDAGFLICSFSEDSWWIFFFFLFSFLLIVLIPICSFSGDFWRFLPNFLNHFERFQRLLLPYVQFDLIFGR